MDRNFDTINFISKYLYFKKTWGSHFCWHHQKNLCLLKQLLKTQEKLKVLEIMHQNAVCIYISWYSKICWFLVKKCWSQYNCVKFHHCRIYVTDFREGGILHPPPFPLHPWTAPKKPILNGVKDVIHILKLLLVRMIAYQICYLICIAVSSCLTFGIGGSRILAASKTSSSWQKSMAGSYLLLFWRVPSYLYVAGVLDPPLKSR